MLKYTGRRGATLLLLAVLDVAIGYSVLTAESHGRAEVYSGQASLFPLWAWAYVWWGIAALLVYSAFRKHDAVGFSLASGIKIVWALAWAIGFIFHGQDRAWISAVTWLAIAVWLQIVSAWPEERQYE